MRVLTEAQQIAGPYDAVAAPGFAEVYREHVMTVARWVAGVGLTADRAGFLLAHDLETAVAVIRASDDASSAVSTQDRVQELVLFSVSEQYFHLRQQLGISVDS